MIFFKNFLERNIRHGLALLSGVIVGVLTGLGHSEYAEKVSSLITDQETAAIIVAALFYFWSFAQSVLYERRD